MSHELAVQGIPFAVLAQEFGTPLFVYDGSVLAGQFLGLRRLLHPRMEMFFSLKANPNLAVCALLRSLGARAEVSSLAELTTARRAGVPAQDIVFPGPGKSTAELAACLDAGIYAIICESLGELTAIDQLAAERGVTAPVGLRVNPGFAVKGSKLTMGGRSRQFGIDEEQLMADPGLARRFPSVQLIGVHAYLGTRILDGNVVAENTDQILQLAERLAGKLGFPLEMVDVGGGLGVGYFDGETDLDPMLLTARLNPVIDRFAARNTGTRMIMELGRYLTAPAGTYVMRVRYVKESMGERFAIVDGGTHHHMAAVGIGSFVKRNFPMRLVNRADDAHTEQWNVAGPLCTPNDTLGHRVALPAPRPGDLIGVSQSGAYGPTASPVLFLSHGYPAEVLVHDGRAHLVHERGGPEDLLRGQHLPDFATHPDCAPTPWR
jgi:diaminopimelate decarboxylase